jgi:hypothetical protein
MDPFLRLYKGKVNILCLKVVSHDLLCGGSVEPITRGRVSLYVLLDVAY